MDGRWWIVELTYGIPIAEGFMVKKLTNQKPHSDRRAGAFLENEGFSRPKTPGTFKGLNSYLN